MPNLNLIQNADGPSFESGMEANHHEDDDLVYRSQAEQRQHDEDDLAILAPLITEGEQNEDEPVLPGHLGDYVENDEDEDEYVRTFQFDY
jgi:hypothetical protein